MTAEAEMSVVNLSTMVPADEELALPFEPLGYRFECFSQLPLPRAKAALRQSLRRWFDSRSGPRGYIVGPVICLWLSAFDRYGPIAIGWIGETPTGVKVTGRAGADLNGIAAFLILLPGLVVLALLAGFRDQQWNVMTVTVGLIVFGLPVILWLGHVDRKDAAPLVRYIRDAVVDRHLAPNDRPFDRALKLTVNGRDDEAPASPKAVYQTLSDLGAHEFVILAVSDQEYMQAARCGSDFILERRDGSNRDHWRAVRHDEALDAAAHRNIVFEDVVASMIAYANGDAPLSTLRWERMSPRH